MFEINGKLVEQPSEIPYSRRRRGLYIPLHRRDLSARGATPPTSGRASKCPDTWLSPLPPPLEPHLESAAVAAFSRSPRPSFLSQQRASNHSVGGAIRMLAAVSPLLTVVMTSVECDTV